MPDDLKNDDLLDLIEWLGELVRQTDSSVLDEWEALINPDAVALAAAAEDDAIVPPAPRLLTSNPRAFRILVRNDFGPASALGHLVMDGILAAAGVKGRRNIASLKLDLSSMAPVGGWVLSFQHKKFAGETDEPMAATFTGSPNVDGVAMSTDNGTTWYRVADLTGTSATGSYQTMSANLSMIAGANGLILGNNVLIRFQQFGAGEVDSTLPAFSAFTGGRAFDDVAVTSNPLAVRPQVDSPALQFYPNPVAGGAQLTLTLPQARGTALVRVLDALGRVQSQFKLELSPTGTTRREHPSPLAVGLYTVLCQTADGQRYSRRVVVE